MSKVETKVCRVCGERHSSLDERMEPLWWVEMMAWLAVVVLVAALVLASVL